MSGSIPPRARASARSRTGAANALSFAARGRSPREPSFEACIRPSSARCGHPARAVRSATAQDAALARKLWTLSEDLTATAFPLG
ncbi:hypothetical protein [Streptomyces lushanensis]|uniref:hypothetical protein n=1 Tax=Streptomyces lushanensis TaxID=1434255 RepID=UPI00114D2B8B|nr:hypothetical protein [Streptomyces lushanensis]